MRLHHLPDPELYGLRSRRRRAVMIQVIGTVITLAVIHWLTT